MEWKVEKNVLLQSIGMLLLGLFFFFYCVGNAIGKIGYYSYMFTACEIIALLILLSDTSFFSRYKRYFQWQICFVLFASASALYTINAEHATAQILALLKILVKVSTVSIICRDFSGIKKMFRIFSLLGGISFFTLLFTGSLNEGWRLGTDLMGNANSFALNITVFMTGAMYCMLSDENRRFRIISIGCFVLDLYMIFLSGGRKFLLYAIVFLYVSFLLRNDGRVKFKNIVIATIVISLAIFLSYRAIMSTPVLYNSIGIRLIGIGTESGALGVSDQTGLMKRGLQMFFEKPIFGWGIGGFQEYSHNYYGSYVYAHSNYIELMADFGIVGLLLYYSQYIFCFKRMFQLKMMSEEKKLFLPLLFSIVTIDVFSISFNQTAFIPLFIMIISGYSEFGIYNEIDNDYELEEI